jgi:hypothetical protein
MKATMLSVVAAVGLLALTFGPPAMAQQPNRPAEPKSAEPNKDAQTTCMDMMQGSGMTDEGKKAMREFMQSPKAPQAMNNMMEMARRMGNGDAILGMTKMMEMMGGRGAMMGGSGSMGQGGMMGDRSQGSK